MQVCRRGLMAERKKTRQKKRSIFAAGGKAAGNDLKCGWRSRMPEKVMLFPDCLRNCTSRKGKWVSDR